jgi:hypothetical protein
LQDVVKVAHGDGSGLKKNKKEGLDFEQSAISKKGRKKSKGTRGAAYRVAITQKTTRFL